MKPRIFDPTAPDAINLGAVKIPIGDFASQGNAVLGIRDSGKTYTATWLAEQLDNAFIPFVAFDPIGVWRFLRNGVAMPGLECVIAGGEHGDLPLTPQNVEEIVRHAMKENVSLVLDLYSMELSKADWRRIVEAAVRLLLYENKATNRLRHVFIEEAAEFVPQMVNREYGAVYAEVEKLARMGGNARLGLTLINQRAEQLNKAVLELCDCLFLHRQKGRLSIQALGKWIEFSGGDSPKIQRALPMLEQGECFVWAAGEEKPVQVTIPKKRTIHPDRRAAFNVGNVRDVSALVAKFPKSEILAKPARAAAKHEAPAATAEVEPIRVPVFADGELVKLAELRETTAELVRELDTAVADMHVLARSIDSSLKRADAIRAEPLHRRPPPVPKRQAGERPTPDQFTKGHRTILGVLAARMPLRLTMNQLGTLCVFTQSTMRTYMPAIRDAGFIDENTDGLTLTPLGRAYIGSDAPRMPTGGQELLDFWKSKLNQGEASILQTLFEQRGRSITQERLEALTHYTSSTLRTYLPTLRRNNLIDPVELRIMPEFLES